MKAETSPKEKSTVQKNMVALTVVTSMIIITVNIVLFFYISRAIDVINEAFENLLDSLFQDMAWDISSDISVMKTMMAQDGLTSEGGMAMQTMTTPQ